MIPHSFARRFCLPLFATVAAGLTASACDDSMDTRLAPLEVNVPAQGLAATVYGIGTIRRAAPHPCTEPVYRDFDFRLGRWEVRDPETDALRGLDEITSELGGCVQMEEFTAPNGFRSRSLSVYDRETDVWHQDFLSANTTNIRFTGGLVGAAMVFTADQLAFDLVTGTVRRRENRVTWTPNEDGTMTSITEGSFDGEPRPTAVSRWLPVDELDTPPPLFIPFCNAVPGFRDLDSWLGSWRVVVIEGLDLGASEVVADLSGCLLEENFVGPNGYQSRSFLFYDFVIGTWFRTLVDVNGEHIELSGAVESGVTGVRLVMTGEDRAPDGSVIDLRVTLAPSGDGSLLQTWEQSRDGGSSWITTLELTYDPAAG